jgi:hypothetical protein
VDDLSRRRLLALGAIVPTASFVLALGRTPMTPPSPDEIATYERETETLTDTFAGTPVAITAASAREQLILVKAALGTPLGEDDRIRLHVVAGRLYCLLGTTQLDIGGVPAALYSAGQARSHAIVSQDRTGHAWARLLAACAEHTADRPGSALTCAQAGMKVAPAGSVILARLLIEAAAAHAKMGDRAAAARALDSAWDIVDGVPGERTPGWHPAKIHPAEWDNDAARVYGHSGQHEAALHHALTGMETLDNLATHAGVNATGHRAYIRAEAARACQAQGDLTQAVIYMQDALTVCAERPIAGVGHRAEKLVNAMAGQPDHQRRSGGLEDQLRDWQITAPTLLASHTSPRSLRTRTGRLRGPHVRRRDGSA